MKKNKQNLDQDKEKTFLSQKELETNWLREINDRKWAYIYSDVRFEIYMLCQIANRKIHELNSMVDEMEGPQSEKLEVLLRTFTGRPITFE